MGGEHGNDWNEVRVAGDLFRTLKEMRRQKITGR